MKNQRLGVLIIAVCVISLWNAHHLYGANMTTPVFRMPCEVTVDLYWGDSDGFFQVDDQVEILLFNCRGGSGETQECQSWLATTKLGKNAWDTRGINGKAFPLGPPKGSQILSVEPKRGKWLLTRCDSRGSAINAVTHSFERLHREWYRRPPVPVPFADGSILLSTASVCRTRSLPLVFVLDVLSGGHGRQPKSIFLTEAVPSLMKSAQGGHYAYCRVFDASGRWIVVPIEGSDSGFVTGVLGDSREIPESQTTVYEKEDPNAAWYASEGKVVILSASVTVWVKGREEYEHLPLPTALHRFPSVNDYFRAEMAMATDFHVSESGRRLYGAYASETNGTLDLLRWQAGSRKWEEAHLTLELEGIKRVRLFVSEGNVYVGLWRYPSHRFEVHHLMESEAFPTNTRKVM